MGRLALIKSHTYQTYQADDERSEKWDAENSVFVVVNTSSHERQMTTCWVQWDRLCSTIWGDKRGGENSRAGGVGSISIISTQALRCSCTHSFLLQFQNNKAHFRVSVKVKFEPLQWQFHTAFCGQMNPHAEMEHPAENKLNHTC